MPFRPAIIAAALAAALASFAVQASSWQPVVAANGDRVEIDQGRILRVGPGRVVAWTRLIPNGELRDGEGTVYSAIQAMNRYDCEGRSFATLRRVYLQGGRALHEEKVASPRDMPVAAGSYDEKLLKAACGTGGAEAVVDAAPAMESRPGMMHADMRSVTEGARARTVPVADTKPADKATDKAAAKATEKPAAAKAEVKPAEKAADKPAEAPADKPAPARPRFIELPKIDKSQLEDPYKTPPKPGEAPATAKPAEATPPAQSPATPAAKPMDAKAAEARVANARSLAKSVEKTMEQPAVSRRQIELQYATTGPRRAPAPRKKPEAEAVVEEHRQIHWSYEGEGAPANWGKLRPDYGTCATGKRQSPIDIRDGIIKVDLEPIKFDYKLSEFRIVDNGHTIQANVGEGSTIHVMGRSYELVQFHFHKPSEERINGRAFDMVVHLVHKDMDGNLAVVAVLLERGGEHPLIQTLWNHMPLEADMAVQPPGVAIDLNRLLPENRGYYTYMGSLTTPPCSEGVLWMVMKQPMQVSSEQIAIFSRLYRHNARPVQSANNRLIKESR